MVRSCVNEKCDAFREDTVTPGSGDFSIGGRLWPGLSKLIEECGEAGDILPELILLKMLGRIQQVAGKVIGNEGRPDHWDGSNLPVRLTEELGDLLAAIDFTVEMNHLPRLPLMQRRREKLALFHQWHANRRNA